MLSAFLESPQCLVTFSRLFMPWHPLPFPITCDSHTCFSHTDSGTLCSLSSWSPALSACCTWQLTQAPSSEGCWEMKGRGISLQKTERVPLTANCLTEKCLFFWAGEGKWKHFFSSHSLLWRNLVCTFWGPEGFGNFSHYYILDWEDPLILLYFFQRNSSCLHKLRIWPLVYNSTKEDSSTMRQIVLAGFRAV